MKATIKMGEMEYDCSLEIQTHSVGLSYPENPNQFTWSVTNHSMDLRDFFISGISNGLFLTEGAALSDAAKHGIKVDAQ